MDKIQLSYYAPFIASQGLYWTYYAQAFEENKILATGLKCLPIILLMFSTLLHPRRKTEMPTLSRLIVTGLGFSSLGDLFMERSNEPKFLLLGITFFGLAHIFYIRAFGWRPLALKRGLLFVLPPCFSIAFYMWTHMENKVVASGIVGYCSIIAMMAWRSLARATLTRPSTLLTLLATLTFVLSDSCIAYRMLVPSFDQGARIVMITYYLAQFGISLAATEELGREEEEEDLKKR